MTYGLLVVLAFGVVNTVEAWPITSYRLFSQIRTGRSVRQVLVAVDRDGTTRPVRLRGDVATTTAHQFPTLKRLPPAEQRTKVEGWLRIAGIDPSTVRAVRLERVISELDPDGGPPTETSRRLIVEVPL